MRLFYLLTVVSLLLFAACKHADNKTGKDKGESVQMTDPLPSWNEGANKKAIIDFVTKTTTEGSTDFIPVADRIACFDNDGTLWSEQPMYFQLTFAIDRVKAMAKDHPEWHNKEPFKALLEGDMKKVMSGGEHALLQLVAASHAGISTEAFNQNVKDWLKTATHPKTGMHYNEMVFQPMLELLQYLQSNDYKTFIVSGGGIDFMRVWAEETYHIPSHQIIGSSIKTKYEVGEDGIPKLIKLPELNFNDDKDGKPVGIHQHIGKRPVLAFGNSDGDYQMLQWTTTATGYPRLGLILHHNDAEREWAYDRQSHIGKLDKGLDDASKNGWLLVDMKQDWKQVYLKK
ncbi:HAD family hydrolase [Niabella ginsengisoli]|uniref:Haloacid dehalogenase-like hydrolase n=1 Tax=Niabella ginsengisoli TaxID=522298 RepID=A0ABS9SLT6_9BACT|nr:HAD family hydrolase [Niabella ginsengisoli]MCH5599312.1 haloacid dehalogenase-like hydrolase [Niabella ginsengisoli]